MTAARLSDSGTPEEDSYVEEDHNNEAGGEEEDPDAAPNSEVFHKLWDGHLPMTRGIVAKVFAKIPPVSLRQDSATLFTFL